MILGNYTKWVSGQLFVCGRTKPGPLGRRLCQVVYFSVFCLHTLLDCREYNYSSLICPDVPRKAEWLQRCTLNIFLKWSTYIGCTPLSAGGLSFKKGGLSRSPFLEILAGKEGMTFFSRGRGCIFYIKNKQRKSEIFKRQKKFISENVYLP